MISVIKSDERYHANHGWLDTRWHFSFSDYHDPENIHWSELRVFNDDVVSAHSGFAMHPHRDMEIITYVIDGELTHRDSAGNSGVIHPGEVQVMSAGNGILHSEKNESDRPVHLLQLWVMPRHQGNEPRWGQRQFSQEDRSGKLLKVVSPLDGSVADGELRIDQDASVYVSSLRAGESVTHAGGSGRHAYVFVIAGDVTLNGTELSEGDQARILDEEVLEIAATTDAELMLLDLP